MPATAKKLKVCKFCGKHGVYDQSKTKEFIRAGNKSGWGLAFRDVLERPLKCKYCKRRQ